jgi:hypothetical protein
VTAGAVPEMGHNIGHNSDDASGKGLERHDKNTMSIFQYAINLFLVHAHLIPFMTVYVGYGTHFYFAMVSLTR